jgi:hypothetical protein
MEELVALAWHGGTCAFIAAQITAYAFFSFMFVVGVVLIVEGCYLWGVEALRTVSSGMLRKPL